MTGSHSMRAMIPVCMRTKQNARYQMCQSRATRVSAPSDSAAARRRCCRLGEHGMTSAAALLLLLLLFAVAALAACCRSEKGASRSVQQ